MGAQTDDLSALEALILTFLGHGFRTSYELQSVANVSVGLGRPLLAGLQKSGAIEPTAEPGPRGSIPYEITDKGRELLKSAIDEFRSDRNWLASHQHLAFESIPRCFFLEWLWGEGANHQDWRSSMAGSIERRVEDVERKRRRILKNLEKELETLPSDAVVNDRPVVALLYSWMRVTFASQFLKVQLELIDKIIEQLGNMPSSTLSAAEFLDEMKRNMAATRPLDQAGD